MDPVAALRAQARHDVAALGGGFVPSTRAVRDVRLDSLMRRGRRLTVRTMREAGLLRPWWARSPLLILVAPLVLIYGAVFSNGIALFAGVVLLVWGAVREPRMSRVERSRFRALVAVYRNAAADALDANMDRLAYGWEEPSSW